MAKFLLLLLIGFVVEMTELHAQQSTLSTRDKSYYLQKSKSQKTAAFLLLGGGATATTLGIIWASNDARDNGIFSADFDAQLIVITAGVLAGIGSIVLFVSSYHNYEKAMMFSAQFKTEPLLGKLPVYSYRHLPGISLVVNF